MTFVVSSIDLLPLLEKVSGKRNQTATLPKSWGILNTGSNVHKQEIYLNFETRYKLCWTATQKGLNMTLHRSL